MFKDKIILASQSPRRKQLLEWAEINFDIVVADIEETYPLTMPVHQVPTYIALQKAKAVKQLLPNNSLPIVAADTVVICNQKIIGKPTDKEHAIHILNTLNGNEHKVTTGVVILHNNQVVSFQETTTVKFKTLSAQQIAYYINTYQPFDKAGAYGIQEWIGVVGIESINGDFYNVMGLPINKLYEQLLHLSL